MYRDGQNTPTPPYGYEPARNLKNHPERLALRRNANIASIGMLLTYALTYGILFFLYWWVGNLLPARILNRHWTFIYDIISLVTYIVAFLAPCILMIIWIRIPVRIALPMRAPNIPLVIAGIFCCLGASVAGGYLSELISYSVRTFFGYQPTMPDLSPPRDSISFLIYLLNVVVAPAFLEEMVFRGVILQSLRRFGDGFALAISSILFALAHGNLVQGPNTLIVGAAIGFFVLRTGSLWTGIIIHFVNNSLAVIIDISIRYSDIYEGMEAILSSSYFIIYIVCAITAFFYLLNRFPGIFRLAPSRSGFSLGKRYRWFFTGICPIILIVLTVIITSRYFEAV